MNNRRTITLPTEPLEESPAEAAARWLMCFQTEQFSPDDPHSDPTVRNAAFFAWARRSSTHLPVFMEMMELELRLGQLDTAALAQLRRQMPDLPIAVSLVSHQENFPLAEIDGMGVNEPRFHRWRALGLAVAGCAGLCFAYLSTNHAKIYTTLPGQRHQLVLSDGSTAQLNTDTQVQVVYSSRERLVVLQRGEAFFSVKHNDSWPFRVRSGKALIKDFGTEFNVRARQQSVSVSVLSGTVRLEAIPAISEVAKRSPQASAEGLVLTAGAVAEVADGKVTRVAGMDAEAATAWLEDKVVLRKRPLVDAVAEFNRYTPSQTLIDDAAAGQVLVDGTFSIGKYQGFLDYVATLPSLSVNAEGDHWVIHSTRAAESSR